MEPLASDLHPSTGAPDKPSRSEASALTSEDVFKLCWDEYKLLQDKIDRIGTFKFQVKGWSATLVLAPARSP